MLWKLRRASRFRPLKLFLIFCVFATLLEIFRFRWAFLSSLDSSLPHHLERQRIFVASTHWNNENVIRSHWNAAVLDLVHDIGVDNIYISIYESGSWDNSKGALRELDHKLERLNVLRTVALDETTHIDEINKPPATSGWIDTPRGRTELRRIPYLSKLRNLSLKPLYELEQAGLKFDKILFLNDVVFTVSPRQVSSYKHDLN